MENSNQTKLKPVPVNISETDPVFNVKDAAAYLKLSKASIYNLVSTRNIPSYKRGRKIYFFRSQLTNWVKEGEIKVTESKA